MHLIYIYISYMLWMDSSSWNVVLDWLFFSESTTQLQIPLNKAHPQIMVYVTDNQTVYIFCLDIFGYQANFGHYGQCCLFINSKIFYQLIYFEVKIKTCEWDTVYLEKSLEMLGSSVVYDSKAANGRLRNCPLCLVHAAMLFCSC